MLDQKQLEIEILSGCLKSRKNVGRALESLNGYKFSEETREWIWKTIKLGYKTHASIPTIGLLIYRADNEITDNDFFADVIQSLKDIKKSRDDNPFALLLDEIVKNYNKEKLIDVTGKVLDAIDENDLAQAQMELAKGLTTVNNRKQRTGSNGIVEIATQALIEDEDQVDFVPTGFRRLDRDFRGAAKGQVWLVCGITGIGKSISMIQVGQAAIGHGARVLHITTEMDRKSITWRYLSRFTSIPEKHLRERRLSVGEKDLLKSWLRLNEDRMNDLLKIEQITPHIGTVNDIRSAIDELVRAGIPPDVLIIDSPDHLRSQNKKFNRLDESTDVWWDIKAITTEGPYVTWVTSQVGRKWETVKATPVAIADNINKVRIADAFISINWVMERGDITGQRFLYLGKLRSGVDKGEIPLQCDLTRMTMSTLPRPEEIKEEDNDLA